MSDDLIESNKRRIRRAGPELWNFMKSLKPQQILSGTEAMKIVDTYGIRPSDLVFFLSIIDVEIQMEEFYCELKERENIKSIRCFNTCSI